MENVNAYPVIENGADLTVLTTQTAVGTNPGSGAVLYGRAFPGTMVGNIDNQSVPNSSLRKLSWTGVIADGFGSYPGGTQSDLVVPSGVKWLRAHFQGTWARSSVGQRYFEIRKNGFSYAAHRYTANEASEQSFLAPPIQVVEGDLISVYAWQNSGASLNLTSTPGVGPILTLEYY
jgi:hypothetical protein